MKKLSVLLVLSFAHPSQAIVIRHDRPDSLYRQLARDYPQVCRVSQAVGTLIDSHWVITAAHVADPLPRNNAHVVFGNRDVSVLSISIHPDFAVEDKHRDLALLKLAEPVTDVTPAVLFRRNDEVGQRIVFVGDGYTGNGYTGPEKGERIYRAAQNTVDSAMPGWIRFTFDRPPLGDDLEGISGPGDSGGPALHRRGDTLFILGISAYNSGEPECTYGTQEFYARVSTEIDWIDSVMSGEYKESEKPHLMRFGENEQGQTTALQEKTESVDIPVSDDAKMLSVLGDILRALEEQSEEQYMALLSLRLIQQHRESNDPVGMMFGFLLNVIKMRGPIVGFHPVSRQGVKIPDSEFPMRPVIFHLADGMPGYFGLALNDAGQIDHLSLFVQEGVCPNGIDCTEWIPFDRVGR